MHEVMEDFTSDVALFRKYIGTLLDDRVLYTAHVVGDKVDRWLTCGSNYFDEGDVRDWLKERGLEADIYMGDFWLSHD